MKPHLLLLLALSAASAHARADAPPVQELRKISVTATRSEREVDNVAGSVTVIGEEQIAAQLARDIDGLVRYEPGISVADAPTRFGLAGFTIRGVDGNRVLIRIDDVRMSDAFAIGSFASARRNLIELDTVKSVEIVRGAASALYGSDALGGVVSFITKDPEDYLGERDSYFAAKSGYYGDDDGWSLGGVLALGGDVLSGLLTYTQRRAGERNNHGDVSSADRTRTAPNPQDKRSDSVLAKLSFVPSADHAVRLALEAEETRVETNVLSSVGVSAVGGAAVNTLSQRGDDRQDRFRATIGHEWRIRAVAADRLQWRLYAQESLVEQDTLEQRYSLAAGPAAGVQRERRFEFEQGLIGGEALFQKTFALGASEHFLTYGLDAIRTRTQQLRDGVQTTLATGARTTTITPDVFPVRDFPASVTRQTAIYAQDEIALADGAWTLTPGLRIDDYRLDPRPDHVFAADNPGVRVVRIKETSVSPKLGALWGFSPRWSAFAQYAHGFRAAPYNDVNIGFTNLAAGYTAIANPNLEAETSDGYELGARGRLGEHSLELATFYNDYDDFIESLSFVGILGGVQVFQSRNVANARIYGFELRGDWTPDASPWRVRYSAAYARGEDRAAEVPLNSIDPLKAVLGLAYAPRNAAWGVELIGTGVARKTRTDRRAGPQFAPSGYATFDLLAHFEMGEHVRVNVGVFNVTDEKYWEWADVRGRAANDPVIDRYTQPGVYASASATVRF
jgi:hemoglobin/transferrin/lactoferrin receptor protein